MHTHPFDVLNLEQGQIIFTPCPGTKETSLQTALVTLKNAGASAVVTLLFDQELNELNAAGLAKQCADLDMAWFQLPIVDDEAPTSSFDEAWQQHKQAILTMLKSGGTVAVHCRGGTGRTGLVTALIMFELGYSKLQAKQLIQQVRPKALTIPHQVNYLNQYGKN